MSRKVQAMKNAPLVKELAMYIAKHPKAGKKSDESVTYVAFSAKDAELNKENKKLIASFVKEGRKVIKAVQTNDKFNPWKFYPVTSV
jgi:hypothetical protein